MGFVIYPAPFRSGIKNDNGNSLVKILYSVKFPFMAAINYIFMRNRPVMKRRLLFNKLSVLRP